mmetsp:Transcript_10264/g.18516  ORF Transcript_10264/g.18516 Transcript_10264/m.18516 type:complete len:221 (+) Transcript_10264:201-863(+)
MNTTAMDPSDYLAVPEDLPPPQEEEPKLVKPKNVKSRFWVHFLKYDLEFHPDKKTTARCNMCGKDISVKQGTGGLINHLKFKHPEENSALLDNDEVYHANTIGSSASAAAAAYPHIKMEETPYREGAATSPVKKKPRHENAYADISMRMDAEKRMNEKHWMEMWAFARKELREVRQDLKEEEDGDAIRDLEGDVRVLKKRKADYAELLGFPRDDMVTEEV